MLWRALPGGRLAKAGQCLALVGVAVAVLFLWVFPAVASRLPSEEVTVSPVGSAESSHLTEPTSPAGSVRQGEGPG